MLREAIELLGKSGLIDGNSLPDSTPGHQYHFRSCTPNLIISTHQAKKPIMDVLKSNGYKVKATGTMLMISK